MAYIEEIESVARTKEGKQPRKELDSFLDDVGRKLAWSRPETGAPKPILDALFDEGKWLFDTCWGSLPAEPSEATRSLLDELVLCSQSLFRFADLGDDGLCRGGPDKGCGVIVSAIDVVVDRLD